MARPRDRPLYVTIHDRRCGSQTEFVCGTHNVEPLLRVHFIRTDDRSDLVIEYFGCGALQCAKPRVLQPLQELAQRQAEGGGTLRHLQWREGVDMHVRQRLLDRAADAEISVSGVVGMDAAL